MKQRRQLQVYARYTRESKMQKTWPGSPVHLQTRSPFNDCHRLASVRRNDFRLFKFQSSNFVQQSSKYGNRNAKQPVLMLSIGVQRYCSTLLFNVTVQRYYSTFNVFSIAQNVQCMARSCTGCVPETSALSALYQYSPCQRSPKSSTCKNAFKHAKFVKPLLLRNSTNFIKTPIFQN